jgi:hypothetical protein
MGMYDTIVLLEDPQAVACPEGHLLRSLQTKELDAACMNTYLLRSGRLYRAGLRHAERFDEGASWRIDGDAAVQESRYPLTELAGAWSVRAYATCYECEPILVRAHGLTWHGDLVSEHRIFVEFVLTLRPGEPLQVERTTGTRDDLEADLRARGLYVLGEDDPLAVAHRALQQAQRRHRTWTGLLRGGIR